VSSKIEIGNQTAFSASRTLEPLELAVAHGFEVFEWFPDKKLGDDGRPAGWDETDMDSDERQAIRKIGADHHIRYTVHAPWQANPLYPEGEGLLKRSLDFARDIGADLVNLHLYMEQGAQAYVNALAPVIAYSAQLGVRLSIENTPLTGPADLNETFRCLHALDMDTSLVGMCLDIGHANLFSGTHNDYIRYIDELAPDVPIIHLHMHENWGECDSHLALFTGPARDNDAGVRILLERLQQRRYSGAMILEQWPQPPDVLVTAAQRLHALYRSVSRTERQPHKAKGGKLPSIPEEPEPHPLGEPRVDLVLPADTLSARIIAAHGEQQSWRQRLNWIQEIVSAPDFRPSPEQLAALAIYLRFLASGEVSCEEDGQHFRPNHHAGAALSIEDRLETVTAPEDKWMLRKIHPWLPSYSSEFQRHEPLTRIRDIAHRNDIPKDLKQEIEHRLQNKLHRCAGPEDFKTSSEILDRITAPGTDYSPDFVEQFRQFHDELSEFFNASTLDQRLQDLLPSLSQKDAAQARAFLRLKAKRKHSDADLLELLKQLTALREHLSRLIPRAVGEGRQRLRLTDIALDDYAFALLSDAANRFDSHDWNGLLGALETALANVRLSGIERPECSAILSELQAWTLDFDPSQGFHLLRLKATLERARRITDRYSGRVLTLFPPRVTALGRALGVAEHAIAIFCEGDIRANVIFQVAKLVEAAQRDIRTLLKLSPWATVVPGESSGRLIKCATLQALSKRDQSVIVLLESAEGDEEIPANIRGILLAHPIPHLSHLGVRARQAGVPLSTREDNGGLSQFDSVLDSLVRFQVTADDVLLGPTESGADLNIPAHQDFRVTVPPVDLSQRKGLVPLAEATAACCGAKAASAARLLTLAEKSAGLFRAPRGLVLPFGLMQQCLEQDPANEKRYLTQQRLLGDAGREDLVAILKTLRSIVSALSIPAEVYAQIQRFFGATTRLAVRSSANGEDLENLASAGLYDSRVGVPASDSADAIRDVWASLWTERATMSRTQNAIPHPGIRMAVLIQEMVEPELSFIMHTANHVSGDRNLASVELAVGLGETLASATQPGMPYRMRCNRSTGDTSLTACASYSQALRTETKEGTTAELIDYSTIPLSADSPAAAALGRRLAKVAEFLETAFGCPQDVEGVVSGGNIHIVQTRPQQG
jgi:phosphoglucan,water dikinase